MLNVTTDATATGIDLSSAHKPVKQLSIHWNQCRTSREAQEWWSHPVELTDKVRSMKYLPGLTARNWRINSTLDRKVEVSQAGLTAIVEEHEITLKGFSPQEILAMGDSEENHAALAAGIFALLSS